MKKIIPGTLLVAFHLFIRTARMRTWVGPIIVLSVGCLAISFSACRTLSTTAGAPPSGPVNGMLYYLPIGKITIKGEFKEIVPSPTPCPTCSPKASPANAVGDDKDANVQAAAAPTSPPKPPVNPVPEPSGGSTTISAGRLTITLMPEVEADEAAKEYYVTPHANYVYEDEARVTVNPKHLLSTGNVTTEDKTVEIVGALASLAARVTVTEAKEVPKEKIELPFYFSFHPSNPDEVERVREKLDERGITFRVESTPTPGGKSIGVTATEAKQLGEQGLLFRPAISYRITLKFDGVDPRNSHAVALIDSTQQFILPDPTKLYVMKYDRMAFVKKVREVGFTDGMLTDFRQKVPSPILGFLGIPKAIIQAIVPIPGAPPPSGSAASSGTTPPKS